jgi:3-oxoacyl-[acyl-carrier protein] reductase
MATARTVLISGGNRGIGYAIAEEFIAQGHRVAVTARSGEGPAGSMTVRADVTDQASVDAAFAEVEAELGAVEVVVANAGITKDTLLMRMTAEDFDAVVDTNLGGSFRLVKRASKGMLKAKYGRIVLISSVVGLYGSAVISVSIKPGATTFAVMPRPPSSRVMERAMPTSPLFEAA